MKPPEAKQEMKLPRISVGLSLAYRVFRLQNPNACLREEKIRI